MRVGIYRGFPASAGGGFQYEASLLDALSDLAPRVPYDLVCLNPAGESLRGIMHSRRLHYGRLPIVPLGDLDIHQGPPESYLSIDGEGGRRRLPSDGIVPNSVMGQALREEEIGLLFALHPSPIGPEALVPFIVPIHDLQHRLQPEFPEVSADGIAALREHAYRTICRYATLVLVDSEAGRQDVIRFYGDLIDHDRIRVLPFFPPVRRSPPPTEADMVRVRKRYGLPDRYFFYPAQFWMHKNHRLIVEALARLDGSDGAIRVVFAGSYTEKWRARTFIEVMALADRLGVRDRIHYLGFVPDRDLPALYSLSAGLVMPTFFGPTNLPPLEAWTFGRPVIVTDLPSIRDQLGDGALYIDPRDADSLADAMRRLWRDPILAADLAASGARRLAAYRHEDYLALLRSILDEAVDRVRTGRTPAYPIAWPQNGAGAE